MRMVIWTANGRTYQVEREFPDRSVRLEGGLTLRACEIAPLGWKPDPLEALLMEEPAVSPFQWDRSGAAWRTGK